LLRGVCWESVIPSDGVKIAAFPELADEVVGLELVSPVSGAKLHPEKENTNATVSTAVSASPVRLRKPDLFLPP
jgi:hypothetical protein